MAPGGVATGQGGSLGLRMESWRWGAVPPAFLASLLMPRGWPARLSAVMWAFQPSAFAQLPQVRPQGQVWPERGTDGRTSIRSH